ncbi:DNA-binding NarL/FixJ family response regulator [Kitasatospora sp. MAA4]|uniref:response regulator transcription factor n=1 Tax=Kitasatospora sp. MAA4 TaxID=3035093 RepID=UPI0024766F76|nr:response regulator transcription factor [Kitasatospora sp. MAA4]MDH6130703.1 DNA-binding NarL/FixJ family response regulator [Kitasatospora sp. MAA4]
MTAVHTEAHLRVLVVDDEALIRSGLAMILSASPEITAVAACEGGAALGAVAELRPDVVLLDIRMPDVDGLTLLGRIRRLPDPPQVAMLTAFDTDEYVGEALRLGAAGFLLKDTDPEVLVRSVRALATGAGCLSDSVVRRVRQYRRSGTERGVVGLSARERQVLGYLGHGLSNAEIATRLHIGVATVKDYVKAVLAKTGAANRVQAAVFADRVGLVDEHAPDGRC